MGVVKEYQGQKLGSKLLNKIIEELTNLGMESIELITQQNNKAAISLYKNFDFQIEYSYSYYYRFENKEENKAFQMKKILKHKKFEYLYNTYRLITDRLFCRSRER